MSEIEIRSLNGYKLVDETARSNIEKLRAENATVVETLDAAIGQKAGKDYVDREVATVSALVGNTKVSEQITTAMNDLATVAKTGSYNDLSNKPTIPAAYTLPTASTSVLGGVKIGSGLAIDANGVLSLNVSNASGVSF